MINITLITHIAQCALHSVHCAKCRLLNDGLLTRSCLTDKRAVRSYPTKGKAMMIKRMTSAFAAVLTAAVMLMCSVCAHAAGYSFGSLYMEQTQIGNTLEVRVSLTSNPGINNLSFAVLYDSRKFDYLGNLGTNPNGIFGTCECMEGIGTIIINCESSLDVYTSGEIVTLYFTGTQSDGTTWDGSEAQFTAVVSSASSQSGANVAVNGYTLTVSSASTDEGDGDIVLDEEENGDVVVIDDETDDDIPEVTVAEEPEEEVEVTDNTEDTSEPEESEEHEQTEEPPREEVTTVTEQTEPPVTTVTTPATTAQTTPAVTTAVTTQTTPATSAPQTSADVTTSSDDSEQSSAQSDGRATTATMAVAVLVLTVTVAIVVGVEYMRRGGRKSD